MPRIKLMKEEAYATLQANLEEVYELINSHPDNGDWLEEFLGFYPFEETKYEFDDFKLDFSENYEDCGCENAIKLYEAFHGAPSNILYSHYFWTWVIFEIAYKQVLVSYDLHNAQSLKDGWFPDKTNRRTLTKAAIVREFMKVKMSVYTKSGENNPYELTPYLIYNKQLYDNMSSRNVSDVPQFCHAMLRLEKDLYDNRNMRMSEKMSASILKSVGLMGSIKLIDTMDETEIESYLREKFNEQYPGHLSH